MAVGFLLSAISGLLPEDGYELLALGYRSPDCVKLEFCNFEFYVFCYGDFKPLPNLNLVHILKFRK